MATAKQIWNEIVTVSNQIGYEPPIKTYVGIKKEQLEEILRVTIAAKDNLFSRIENNHKSIQETIAVKTNIPNIDIVLDSTDDVRSQDLPDNTGFDGSFIKDDKHNFSTIPQHDYSVGLPDGYVIPQSSENAAVIDDIKAVSTLQNNTTRHDSERSLDNSQDPIFWLRRCYLEWSDYQVLTVNREETLTQKLAVASNTEKDKIQQWIDRSNRFKSYLTFICIHQDTKVFDDFLAFCSRIDLSVVASNDIFDGRIYTISPNWDTQASIKMTTVLRILSFSTHDLKIDNDFLLNYYMGRDTMLRCPQLIALDILSGNASNSHENSVLSSAIKLNVGNIDRIVKVRKLTEQLHIGFQLPSEVKTKIQDSVSIRSIGKVKRTNAQSTGTYCEPKDRDGWSLLSQRVTSMEIEIIASNSKQYRDCLLVYKRYQLEENEYGRYEHPVWLNSTMKRWGIDNADNIVGYIGVKYPNGKVEKIGVIHQKLVKNKVDKSVRSVLWYTELERYQHKQSTTGMVSSKIEVNTDICCFLSLYGIAHNQPIKPSKLVTINDTSKHINVNWQSLTGLKVAPMNKQGQILWHPKESCPFTIIP
ncbi:hypothetical protein [Scytonema sp. NUACC26]|uniref:hypothetical protein n=1 Tax=Scytonema sp. NUACC26 TaxID=3140176 RepID=UPI0034DC698D